MKKPRVSLVLLPLLLAACGGSGDGTVGAADASPSRAPAPSDSPEQDSASATGTAPPRCVEDPVADSKGPVDLTSVGISTAFDKVTFTYEYRGDVPQKGSLLFSSRGGHKQYGYKAVDGQKSGHFVFDFSLGKQKNVTAGATIGPKEAVVSFAASDVDLAALANGTATVSIEGSDVDACTLTLD